MHVNALISGLVIALPLLAAGCSIMAEDQTLRDDTLLGITRVRTAASSHNVQAYRISTLGAGNTERGAFLGWRRSELVISDPAKCQLLVIIRSDVETANAASVLEKLKGENVCAADFSRPAR